jgi:hypothetical protein
VEAGVHASKEDLFFEIPLQQVTSQRSAVYMYEKVANEVPIGLHVTDSSRGVVFLDDEEGQHHDFSSFSMPPGANNYFHDPSQFLAFSAPLLRDIVDRGVPAATTSYYQKCAALDCFPLTFFHVPHVLIRGELQVGDCRIVSWCE